jgi:hypothetical protein
MKKPRKQPARKNKISKQVKKAAPPPKKWSVNQRKAALRRRQTPLEIALSQIPKLSVAECKLLWEALKLPNAQRVKNIKRDYRKGRYKDVFDAPVKIALEPHNTSYGHWVNNRWRPYSKRFIKKQHRQMTISDRPEEPH